MSPTTVVILILSISVLFAFSLFLSNNPFYYAFVLVLFSLLSALSLTIFSYLSSVYPILFLLIYVGGIMVMIGYVCSVSPLPPTTSSNWLYAALFFSLAFVLVFLFFSLPSYCLSLPSPSSIISFYYSSLGSNVFLALAFLLIVILLVSSSLLKVKSTLRSS